MEHLLQGKMLDLIFVVDDAKTWHRDNLARNPHHYSFVHSLGVNAVASIQRASAGVYYNTLVPLGSEVCFREM